MSEQLLDGAKVRTTFQQMRGKGVAKRVRADLLTKSHDGKPLSQKGANTPIC